MGEGIFFWLCRVAAGLLDFKLLRSSDGGLRVGLVLAMVVIVGCLVALSMHA